MAAELHGVDVLILEKAVAYLQKQGKARCDVVDYKFCQYLCALVNARIALCWLLLVL